MSRTALRAMAALVAALVLGGLAWRTWTTGPRGRPDVLVVTIDTLRADRLGSAGYAAARTPHLDALARRGLRFAQATTVAPLTLPAHASLFTGTFPGHHGVRDNGGFYLADEHRTLAEVFHEAGYRTGGFVGAFVLDSRWGIAQGFERYFDDFDLSRYEGTGMDAVQRRGDEVVQRALAWLDEDAGKPTFTWVHLYDPHLPYTAPEPYASRFPNTASGAYDAEIAWTDDLVGRLLGHLDTKGKMGRTVVVVVGDHGESLGEHREWGHGFFVYDTTVQVPLIVAGPTLPARDITDQVRLVDVMPTVLELAGLPAPAAVQGRSLLPFARGERLSLVALSESWYPRYHYGWSELVAVRDGRYKLIAAPRRELYDVSADPAEAQDRAAAEPARAEVMAEALRDLSRRTASAAPGKAPAPLDPEVEERLAALGYLGAPSARALDERPRRDPKDTIDLYNLVKSAAQDSAEGRLDAAAEKLRQAVAADPEMVEGHVMIGNVHVKAGRHAEAVEAYRRALALDDGHQGAVFSLALAYKNLGRLDDAAAGFQRALSLDAKSAKVRWQLADLWMQKGDFARAESLLKEGLALEGDRAAFLVKLGECYIEAKRLVEAEKALQDALAARSSVPSAHYNLGLVHEARGDLGRAVASYEAELARDPRAHRAAFNLARLHLRARRPDLAVARLRAAVEARPDFGEGYLYLAKALLDTGQLDAAQQAAREGLARRPDRSVAPLGHYVLADVYTRLGRHREAARELQQARRLERGA